MPLSLVTELEAVNRITSTIGNSPVTSIAGVDALAAQRYLLEASSDIQGIGWWFNRDTITLTPQGGIYIIPTGTLSVLVCRHDMRHLIQRGPSLYNTKTQVNTGHTEDLDVVLTTGLDWTDLPEVAKTAIVARAGQRFADRSVGDRTIHAFTEQDEQDAMAALMAMDISLSDYNSNNRPGVYRVTNR